jgi:UPF0755 protein
VAQARRRPAVANRREALTLASIVEKGYGRPGPSAPSGGVYINRLRRRMKLESDPTTITAITQCKVPLNASCRAPICSRTSPYQNT